MKKLLALLLAMLIFCSLPLPAARAEEGTEGADAAEPQESPDANNPSHNRPSREKSLEYWESVELPQLTLTGNLREDVLIIARSQLGYCSDRYCYEETASGSKRFYTRYGAWDGATFSDWCDTFVSFCIYYGGNTGYPGESSCARHMFHLKTAGYWREWNSYVPKPGDLVFFKQNSASLAPNHVGLVEKVIPGEGDEGGTLVTIEGNMPNPTGGTECVRRMTRSLDQVVGYGTYERGKTYTADYTVRSDGWEIIGEDSVYFIERPTQEALKFLGFYGSRYYEYWFPEESIEDQPEEDGSSPEPEEAAEDGTEPEQLEEAAPVSAE